MENFIVFIVYFFILGTFGFDLWLSILNYRNSSAKIPETVTDVYDENEYKKWLAYSMENFRFGLVAKVVDLVVFLLILGLGGFLWIDKVAVDIAGDFLQLRVLIFLGIYFFFSFFIGIFQSYYSTFKIEEKYGFNKSTKKTFFVDLIKQLILTVVLGGGLIYLVTEIYTSTGDMFLLITWIVLSVIILLVNILYVPLILPIFNKLEPLEEGTLKDKIQEFSKVAGYQVSKISVIDASKRSTKLNAFFTGFGRFKKVILYDTLIGKLSDEEIVAVLAHEIGHNKHKHVVYNIFQTILMLSVFIGAFVLVNNNEIFSTAFGFESGNFGFAVILFTVLIDPLTILIDLFSSTLSRKHEYQADAYAGRQYSQQHMESSLKRVAKENFSNLTPHPLYVKLRYSHPPLSSRVEAIRKL